MHPEDKRKAKIEHGPFPECAEAPADYYVPFSPVIAL